jgi:superfamily II DNA/RNA helicase
MTFADLGLSDELLRAVTESGYSDPTPIQRQAIPSVLMNRDLIGIAQTGTGKTASFVLPMIDILAHGRSRARMPRSLILEPTRELAAQVAENFEKYGKYHKLSMALLIGGVSMGDQQKALEKGVDVLIATPGRLMDLFGRGKILLNGCSLLVIDEADRMLDMGFIPDIEEICSKLPSTRQTLLFSATMPAPIKKLADRFLSGPKTIEVSRPASSNLLIDQRLLKVDSRKKKQVIEDRLRGSDVRTAIIFCNRKTTVRELAQTLKRAGLKAGEIHGDMEQAERIRELDRFKDGEINILVASDVAARGLDVKDVSHVFNYDVPWHPDDYIHRIGRTGRAGRTGIAITFATSADAEAIEAIEKLTGSKIPAVDESAAAPARQDSGETGEPAAAAEDNARREGAERKPRERSRRRKEPEAVEASPPAEAESAAMPAEAAGGEDIESAPPRRRAERRPRREKPRPAESVPDEPLRQEARRSTPRREEPRPAESGRDEPIRQETRRSAPRREEPRRPDDQDGDESGWNGPVPGFLSQSFGS